MKDRINDKRLTKKQVLEIIKTEGRLHEEYTNFFEERYASGYIKQDKVYELPFGRYLYVFDEKGMSIRGKGDIFTKEYIIKLIKWTKRVRDNYANKRGNSVDHWRFYSKYRNDFTDHVQQLVLELAERLKADPTTLDYSYESLDLLSNWCQQYEVEQLFDETYDNIVAYVGEVIKKRVNGFWAINNAFSGGNYPYISINSKRIQYMPINVVWGALGGIEDIDLRAESANEVRRNALSAKFERDFGGGNK
jgi:hypothetical protein